MSLRGLRLTRRGEAVLMTLMLCAVVATLVTIMLAVESQMCHEAQETGTQWRIDRVCPDTRQENR